MGPELHQQRRVQPRGDRESTPKINSYDILQVSSFGIGCHCTVNAYATRRFNRLAWGLPDTARTQGVLVAGMENGDLDIWDPSKIVAKAE